MKKIKMLLVPILSAVFCFCFALAFLPVAARAENKSGSYFMTGTDTEQTFVYGTVGGEMGSFTPDGGGSVAGRKLNTGEEITYKFSIDEAITSTDLKLYGNFGGGAANGGVTVKWSVDGETFETLATASQTAVYKTGVYKFSLTEDDALSGNNTFYIRLTATADIYVSSVYAGTDYGISADATSVTLVPGSEAAMKHYVVAKNFESAYGGTPWLFVLNGGEIAYRFALPETWKNAVLSYGADSSVTVKYSDSDGNVISAEGANNTIDLQSGIAKNTTGVFDITFGATAGNAIFTSPITLTKADSNEVIFLAGDDAEKEHLVSLSNENLTSLAGDNSQSAAVAHALDKDDYITYKFRMPASMTAGQLRLLGRLARDTGNSVTVDYSFDGESWASLTVGGAIYNTGIYRCALNEENVFAEGNKEFYIRVTAVQDGLALYGVYVGTGESIVKDETTVINAMTENHLRYLSANNLEFIFFNNGAPTLEILNGGSMTYYFDLPDNWANAKIAFNVLQGSIDMKYVAEGVEAVISSGADLEKYLKDNNGNTFYIVLGATGNCLFDNLTVTKAEPTGNYDEPEGPEIVPGKGDNLNEAVPADCEEVYFNVNTEAENAYKYYNENAAFDSTHSGIGVNDANGSWNASANNARVLRAGEYLVYDFDMEDEATTARLVIYGSKALKVSVSTDNGENWTDIQTTVSPYQLGYNVYLLTEENALAGENNAFRLKIECSSTCYVNEIYVATKEVAVEGSVRLVTHSIEMMRYFYAGSDNYTYVSYNKTPFIFLVGKDKFVTFRFPIAEGTEVKSILSTLIANPNQNVSLYVSADDEDYQYLYTATTGGGTPPVKQFDVPEELAEADVLYVKAVSEAGQSFVYDVTLCVDKKDEASGEFEVYTGEEGSYAYNIDGTILQYTDLEERIFRTVPKGGKAIYKIDLPDEADRVQIGFYLRGEFTISVSADGVNYQPVLEAFSPVGVGTEQTVCLYDELENNDGNILYIMIEGHGDPNDPEDDNTVFIAAVNFTTAGVPDKPEDTDPTDSSGGSFDYEDSESSIAGESEKDSETAESTGTGSGCLGGITPAAFGAGLCMAALAVIRRKKRI